MQNRCGEGSAARFLRAPALFGSASSLVGASANVVLSGIANREGYPITFMGFTKVGFPIMIVTVAIATVYLLVVF